MTLRIGTRGSDLALWQARHVAAALERAGQACELVVLVTRGDRIDDVPLQTVAGKGFFTQEIEQALRSGAIDLAVHSHKDLPSALEPDLVIAAVPPRASPAERLLVAPAAHDPAAPFLPLVHGARVGTSAPRRAEQLSTLRPDLVLAPLRGNVPTRVRRLREGRYDAILLASAGLDRLGLDLSDLCVRELPLAEVVPAPAQGALAIETRADDHALRALLARVLHDASAAEAVAAERLLLGALGGGCNLPLGASLRPHAEGVELVVFLGADHPRAGLPARWLRLTAASPDAAARAAIARLDAGLPTGCGPLAGERVAISGSATSLAELEARLTTLGATVVREVVLVPEARPAPTLAARLAALRAGDVLCLTSAHAARALAGETPPPGVRVGAVGQATARALADVGLHVDWCGTRGATELAAALALAPGTRVLWPCAEEPRPDLAQALAGRGVELERLVVYRTRPVPSPRLDAEATLRLYASPSAVAALLPLERAQEPRARRLALGPSTAAALAQAGLAHTCARSTAPEDVLAALLSPLPSPEVTR